MGDTSNTFRGEGYWNFAGRSYLDFGYVKLAEDGSKTDHEGHRFQRVGLQGRRGGQRRNGEPLHLRRLPVRDRQESERSLRAFARGQLHALFGRSSRRRQAFSGRTARSSREAPRPNARSTFPFLSSGLDFEVRLASTLTLSARARGIGVTIDPYSGSWIEYAGFLNWYFAQNFGIGGGYEYQKIHLKKNESEPDAFRFDQRFDGPRAYFVLTF